MLVKGVATGDPGQSSSGWVEYLKCMTKTITLASKQE